MPSKKKIIIFTSTGGGGHIAATNALMEYFGDTYLIQPSFPLKTFLSPLDIAFSHTLFGNDGEIIYNYFVRKEWYWVVNFVALFGCRYFKIMNRIMIKRLLNFLRNEQPDLIISLIPMINAATLEACKQLNIPFLLIPTDFNATFYLCNLNKPSYEKFIFALPFQDEKIREILKPAHIPDTQIKITGSLIRHEFLLPKDAQRKESIKKEFDVMQNKPVIMILVGAQGGDTITKITQTLFAIKSPAHILICIGKNKDLESKITHLKFPDHISFSIIGYTNRIADLMAISDILVTKSGPNSIAEALYSSLPMLVDATRYVLSWERFNLDFVERNGFGRCFKSHEQLITDVNDLLTHPEKLRAIKHRMAAFDKKSALPEIRKIIEGLISDRI